MNRLFGGDTGLHPGSGRGAAGALLGHLGACPGVAEMWEQALGAITAVPVTGPQVSSLQRLAGQGVTVLPQVRPKTLIPDSLPIAPGRDRPPKQPPTFQKATVVSIKNPSPALPTANNTVSHAPAPGSQPQALAEPAAIASPLSSAGVAYAILTTAPSNAAAVAPSTAVSVVSDSVKVQPLLISADKKVIIIQPQVQTQPESTAESRPPTEEPSQGAQATKKKKEDRPLSQENPEKIAFMVALGLVTTEHLEEIQSKRQERKRRSTANPAYSGLLETERKRLASNYLNTPLFLTARANEDPCWKPRSQKAAATWVENRRPARGEDFLAGGGKPFRLCRSREAWGCESLLSLPGLSTEQQAGWAGSELPVPTAV
uniref:PHD finger protein 21B isoform X3 n=1 Tax=Halichoerus grypus TaxID=9711 RepID=UPI0016595960|nr:PHD finger protein 21B isoform X3 [Halichoerus grypus]